MRKIKLIFTLLIVISFCIACVNKKTEDDYIKDFNYIKFDLDKVINYVESKYFLRDDIKNLINLNFILESIDYDLESVLTDDYITSILNEDIHSVSFHKTSNCLEKYTFDEVRFQLNGNSDYTYYYVYVFCSKKSNEIYESLNYKSLPLENKWFLEVEKN